MLGNLISFYKQNRQNFNDEFRLRIHRAISWLEKSSLLNDDEDLRFITLWVSFNAAYAKELSNGTTFDKQAFMKFITLITQADKNNLIQKKLWNELPQECVKLLNDKYTFQAFWKFQNGTISEQEWLDDFHKELNSALSAVKNQNTKKVLLLIFLHIYILRNQVIHGSSTYNSKVNRAQLHTANKILASIVPLIMTVMMENHNTIDWGKPFFPPILE